MPSGTTVASGNISVDALLSVALSPASVGANTTAEQTFTVPGLLVGDFVTVQKPSTQAGIAVVGSRVTAANTLGITFGNWTGGGIVPTAGERYIVKVARYEDNNVSNPPGALV